MIYVTQHVHAKSMNFISNAGHLEAVPVTMVYGDVRKPDDVMSAVNGVDCVIHTAALISVGTCPDRKGMEEVNVRG